MSEFKEYPKWIDHPSDVDRTTKDGTKIPSRILVQDAKEEAKVLGKSEKKEDAKEPAKEPNKEPEKKWPNK